MRWKGKLGLGMAFLLGTQTYAPAQNFSTGVAQPDTIIQVQVVAPAAQPAPTAQPAPMSPAPLAMAPVMESDNPHTGGTVGGGGTYGPASVQSVKFLQGLLPADSPLVVYGWLEGDYTYRSSGAGRTTVAPVMNRYGNEALLRQAVIRIEKPLDPNCWSWGFNVQAMAGADAAFINPTKGAIIRNPDPRMGFEFADLNLTAHAPILTDGGVDFKIGRQTTVLGSQAAQAPWRVFASSDYQWYAAQEGRFTGITANWHVNKQLDVYAGVNMGWGTFFEWLSVAPTYIMQVNYGLDESKDTLITGSITWGPERPGYTGLTYSGELRLTQKWSPCFSTILQSQMVYSNGNLAPARLLPKEHATGVYLIAQYHLNECVDLNFRAEWYEDLNGGGYPGGGLALRPNDYYATTVGVNYHPNKWLELKPELRYDFADRPAFGAFDRANPLRSQFSAVFNVLVKF